MRILVIDDTEINRKSAAQTLTGHEVTIVASYDEAYKLLLRPIKTDHEKWGKVNDELERRGHTCLHDLRRSKEERDAALAERDRIELEFYPPRFDVVLSDLLMPASRMTLADEALRFAGELMPVGFGLLFLAVHSGAKYAAVATATNHHDHPFSAMIDPFDSYHQQQPPYFTINGTRVAFCHAPCVLVEGTICPECQGSGNKEDCPCAERNDGKAKPDCEYCHGSGHRCWRCKSSGKAWGKDWGKILAHLTGQPRQD